MWTIDGNSVEIEENLNVRYDTVSIAFLVNRDQISTWRAYDTAGDIRKTLQTKGQFRVSDDANRSSTVSVSPDDGVKPPLSDFTAYVQSYTEEHISPSKFRVSLTFLRTGNIDNTTTINESGEYELVTANGTIGLDDRDIQWPSRQGSVTGSEITLSVFLTDTQAQALIDSVAFPEAVVERSVPDGDDIVRDTSGGPQTVELRVPNSIELDETAYAVRSWGLEFDNYSSERWIVELTIRRTGRVFESATETATLTPVNAGGTFGVEESGAVTGTLTPVNDGAVYGVDEVATETATLTPTNAGEATAVDESATATGTLTPVNAGEVVPQDPAQAQMMAHIGQSAGSITTESGVSFERAQQLVNTIQ